MLCPEVWNFPPPKVVSFYKKGQSIENAYKIITSNNFYKSTIITCPDEMNVPKLIDEALVDDSDYYRISHCSVAVFLEPCFIKSFVKTGKLYCISVNRNCVIQNCASVTPDGILTLHVLEFIFQTLGLEGTKSPHGFMEIKIDLLNPKAGNNQTRNALAKLEKFDFNIAWEPNTEEICPSSIAKYFADKNIPVTCQSLEIERLSPDINEVPSLIEAEIDEVVEWIGMLAHNGDLAPTEGYISTYSTPECASPLNTKRICLLIVKGMLTPSRLNRVLNVMSEYVESREIENYWACMSIQSMENSLWRWNPSAPSLFQSQNNSCNVFFTGSELLVYCIGQLKYS
ncbi:ribonuclease P protein subunit p40-like [Aricia agestis]|uniref:ribonuclease P protein subunit p40-like n=1 Tax=Aricia agestis TaxID=91739 RepID=UPI001C2031CD|nr:ribonuclease P protein subunit p40-like [Aricia agestis]